MKLARVGLGLLLVAVAFACGERLIRDPSFELWCGKKLCAPWESIGEIERVGTWHERDYGVSLGDGAEISQLSEHAPVECIEFTLIADVSAEAEVQLELDFMDDGQSESTHAIAESHWARVRFLVAAPKWYQGLRFRVRKLGHGRAVLAQLAAESSSDCEGDPVVLEDLPAGARCEQAESCAGEICDVVPQRFVLKDEPLVNPAQVCSGCAGDDDCADGEVCGVIETEFGPARSCVAAGSGDVGAFCEHDAQCASGHCAHGLPFSNATCAECTADGDCAGGEVCGVDVLDGGAARVCKPAEPLPLGELCGGNSQCESGVCCFGACSECCGEWFPCESGAECGSSNPDPVTHALLCGPGQGDRAAGEPCGSDADCEGRCDLPESECLLPGDEDAHDYFDATCRVAHQLAGVCR